MKTWDLKGDILEVVQEGKVISVSANQVFESVLECVPIWNDLPVGKCGAATVLEFSRYPVDVVIILTSDTTTGMPCINYEAVPQKGLCFDISSQALSLGHVVHDGTWYPCTAGRLEEIESLLN